MTEIQQLARADAADALLSHPLIAEALANYEQELIEAWTSSPQRDADGREKLKAMHTAATHFRSYLQRTVETGKLIRAKPLPTLVDRAGDRVRRMVRATGTD